MIKNVHLENELQTIPLGDHRHTLTREGAQK